MPLAIQNQHNIQMISNTIKQPSEKVFSQFVADENIEVFEQKISKAVRENDGMDAIPTDILNRMVDYSISHGKVRNAMLFICMANWGMRISDLVRVKFAHIIDQNGKFRDGFSLENGEKKTGKRNRYYNNEAVKQAITIYLEHPFTRQKRRYDYLFTSDSGNGNYTTLLEIEREENYPLEKLLKLQNELDEFNAESAKKLDILLQMYVSGKITEEEFFSMKSAHTLNGENLLKAVQEYQQQRDNFNGITPDAENIQIQKHITKQAAEYVVKSTLLDIGVYPINCKDKIPNTDLYLNTHSLRKTFTEAFYECGRKLKLMGQLEFDADIHKLVQDKLMHKNIDTTNHYSKAEQKAFETICMAMNIGLEILNQYV